MKPMVIAAPNGARRGKSDHPNLPLTVGEIAAEAVACQQAGASVFHLHVRSNSGEHSLDPGRYLAAIEAISDAAEDMVVQITTESAGMFDLATQIACVKAVRPESVSVAWREFSPESSHDARQFYGWASDEGLHVQHIHYSPEDITRFRAFGMRAQSVLLVLGEYQGEAAQVADLPAYLAAMGGVRDWCVCAFGRNEHAVVTAAMEAGGHARVGFENNLWLQDGSIAKNTAALVAQIKQEKANANEVRKLWHLT